jgi:hypothetical protein
MVDMPRVSARRGGIQFPRLALRAGIVALFREWAALPAEILWSPARQPV